MQLVQQLRPIDGGCGLGRRRRRPRDVRTFACGRLVDRLVVAAQLCAQREHAIDDRLFVLPALLETGQAVALAAELVVDIAAPRADVDAHRRLAVDDRPLDLHRLDAPPRVLDLGGNRVLAHGDAGARRIEQAHRLVGQLARGNVAMGELDGRLDRLVEQLHAMVLLEHACDAAQHEDRFQLVGLGHLHDLESASQRRVLLDVLLVFGPRRGADRAQRAARQCGLEQVGRVAGAGRAAGANQRMHLVDEEDDRLRARLHFVDQLAQPLLELAFHRRAGLQQAEVEREQRNALQLRRHVTARESLREAFDDRRLADAGFAGQDRVVLPAPHQDVDDLADLLVAAGHGVHLALLGFGGEVDRVFLDRLLLAHRRRRHRAGHLAGLATGKTAPVLRTQAVLAALGDDRFEIFREVVGLDLLELPRDREQHIAQARRLQDAEQQVAASDLAVAELQRAVDPGALDRVGNVLGEIGERRRAARQPVERRGDVARQRRRVERVVANDDVDV